MDYHRRSIRLKGYNYSENWYYFVTICSQNRGNVFGEIVGARRDSPKSIKLNKNGKIINNVWKTLPEHNNVILDEFIIMPDHVHFILVINNKLIKNGGLKNENFELDNNKLNDKNRLKIGNELKIGDELKNGNELKINNKGGLDDNEGELDNKGVFDENKGASRRAPTLGFIVGMFKTECTKQINKLNKTPGIQLWQRNYYERIIRNEKEYLMIREYIKENPFKSPAEAGL